jgi:hypothetical protein
MVALQDLSLPWIGTYPQEVSASVTSHEETKPVDCHEFLLLLCAFLFYCFFDSA